MTADRLTPQRETEIAARWEHIPTDEQPRIAVTNSSRGGSLLNALGHAREDVPALLAELAAVRKERDEERARLAQMRAARDVIASLYRDMEASRDRFRTAWRNARERAASAQADVEFVEQQAKGGAR